MDATLSYLGSIAGSGQLSAPAAPTTSAGGTTGPGIRTEYFVIAYNNANGSTPASAQTTQALTAGQLSTVTSPAASGNATTYDVYGSSVNGSGWTKQNTAPIAIGTNWTEPNTGLTTNGAAAPTVNATANPATAVTIALLESANTIECAINALYSALSGTTGLSISVQESSDGSTYTAVPGFQSITVTPTANVVSNNSLRVTRLSQLGQLTRFIKLLISNLDITNASNTAVLTEQYGL